MNKIEQKAVNDVWEILRQIRIENSKTIELVKEQVNAIDKKVEKKYAPVTFEQDILSSAQTAIAKSIHEVLTGYNSPLSKLVISVVEENQKFLRSIISDSFNEVIRTEDFKRAIVDAFSHKVARSIISNNDGLFDKVSNELKQDAVFKSKMALAVSNVVEECLLTKTN